MLVYALLGSLLVQGAAAKPERHSKIGKSSSTAGKGEVVAPKTEAGTTYITLEVAGKNIPILQDVARNPLISDLLATSLENDKDATEIPISGAKVTPETVAMLVRINNLLTKAERAGDLKYADLTPARKKQFVDKALSILGRVKDAEVADLIFAANYLGAPILLDVALWHYASLIKAALDKEAKAQEARDEKGGVESYPDSLKRRAGAIQILKSSIPRELLPALALQYFLRYADNIDKLLAVKPQYIPVEILRGYGLLGEDFAQYYPNLQTNPNEVADNPDARKRNALSYAISSTQPQAVSAILQVKGVDVNAPEDFPPLIQAVVQMVQFAGMVPKSKLASDIASGKVVRALLEHGANILARDYAGNNAWGHYSEAELVKLFVAYGMPVSVPVNDELQTILMHAVHRGDIDLVRWLLNQPGIDVNALDRMEKSVLYYQRSPEMVGLLRSAGAQALVPDPRVSQYQKDYDASWEMPWERGKKKRKQLLKEYEDEIIARSRALK